jgi:hypothetical protein
MTVTTIVGLASWAQIQVPSQFDKYELLLTLDDENAKILEGGLISHRLMHGVDSKGVDYGENWCRLYRKSDDGKPTVVGPDGHTPFDGLIGNGSKVLVQYESWVTKRGGLANGHRILGLQVLNLVPYGQKTEASFEDKSNEYDALPELDAVSDVVFGDEEPSEDPLEV